MAKEYTIDQIKKEVDYYIGRPATDDEAREISWYVNKLGRNLSEVISDYYNC